MGILSLVATMIENLKSGIIYSYLTNSEQSQDDFNDLNVFKFVFFIFAVIVLFVQIRIWIFKVGDKFKIGIRALEVNEFSLGKSTLQIALIIATLQICGISYWIYQGRRNTSDPLIDTIKSYVFSTLLGHNFIGIVWVVTNPNMYKYYKNELKFLTSFKCPQLCTNVVEPDDERNWSNLNSNTL